MLEEQKELLEVNFYFQFFYRRFEQNFSLYQLIHYDVKLAPAFNLALDQVLSRHILEVGNLTLYFIICSLFFHLLLRADTTSQVDCRLDRYC